MGCGASTAAPVVIKPSMSPPPALRLGSSMHIGGGSSGDRPALARGESMSTLRATYRDRHGFGGGAPRLGVQLRASAFSSFTAEDMRTLPPAQLERLWRIVDRDGSGTLSHDEVAVLARAIATRAGELVDEKARADAPAHASPNAVQALIADARIRALPPQLRAGRTRVTVGEWEALVASLLAAVLGAEAEGDLVTRAQFGARWPLFACDVLAGC